MNLVEALRQRPQTGFIFSAKNDKIREDVNALGYPNILMQAFVPQKDLLNHAKVKMFITHCGGTSVTESLYFGKPMLGFPVGGDQRGLCMKLGLLGVGVFGIIDGQPEMIAA